MTLSKLARLANVSVSTVSKAFSGSEDINENTREMIFDVAKKNKCFKEFYNAKYPKFVVAVICPEYESRYYAGYLSLIQQSLTENGAGMCVSVTDFDAGKEADALDYYSKYAKADGIIVIGGETNLETEFNIPIVSLCSSSQNNVSFVTAEYYNGVEEAIDCFVSLGHKKIGFVGEGKTLGKLEYFKKAMEKNSLTVNEKYISVSCERFEKGGYDAMNNIFNGGDIPTAIFAAYDYMAIGAIKSIEEHGLSVPFDISVCGSDDIQECEYLLPSLSSVRINKGKMCTLAVGLLMEEIRGKNGSNNVKILVEPEFVKRDSIDVCKESL